MCSPFATHFVQNCCFFSQTYSSLCFLSPADSIAIHVIVQATNIQPSALTCLCLISHKSFFISVSLISFEVQLHFLAVIIFRPLSSLPRYASRLFLPLSIHHTIERVIYLEQWNLNYYYSFSRVVSHRNCAPAILNYFPVSDSLNSV